MLSKDVHFMKAFDKFTPVTVGTHVWTLALALESPVLTLPWRWSRQFLPMGQRSLGMGTQSSPYPWANTYIFIFSTARIICKSLHISRGGSVCVGGAGLASRSLAWLLDRWILPLKSSRNNLCLTDLFDVWSKFLTFCVGWFWCGEISVCRSQISSGYKYKHNNIIDMYNVCRVRVSVAIIQDSTVSRI